MPELVNMALSVSERKTMLGECCDPEEGPKFPWGLSVHLGEESIVKLGMELPEVGAEMTLTARVVVERVSASEEVGGGVDRDINLQITDMALDTGAEPKDAASILFRRSDNQQA